MKESVLKAIKEDGCYFVFNTELNDKIIKEYIFENIIKNLTIEDMDELVNITPTPTEEDYYHNFLVGFNLKFLKNFSLAKRRDIMNEQLLKEITL
jgi:hypothetical protein